MTIFDTLRYPISNLPTEAELTALPNDLYSNWLNFVGITSYIKPYIVSRLYNNKRSSSAGHVDIIQLRKMIEDYEPL